MSSEFLYQAAGIHLYEGSIVAIGPDGQVAWRIDADGSGFFRNMVVSLDVNEQAEMDDQG